MFVLVDQLEALKVIHVNQLKKKWVENIRFKNTF